MRWEADLGQDAPVTAPVSVGDAVVLGTSEHLAVAVQDGKRLWAVDNPDKALAAPEQGPEGQLLVTGQSGTVYRLSNEGAILWQGLQADTPARWTPDGGILARHQNHLTRTDANGQITFTFEPKPHPLKETKLGPCAAGPDGVTYVTTGLMLSDPKWELKALDASGQELWSRPIPQPSDLEVQNGCAVVGGPRGVKAFQKDGSLSWSSTTHCQELLPAPQGGFYVASVNEVERLSDQGQELWKFQAAGDRRMTTGMSGFQMAVAPDGTLALADVSWNWKEFGGAATLTEGGQLVELGREGSVLGLAFTTDGNLIVSSEKGLRAVNPGTQARQSPLIREEDQWIVVGSVRVRRKDVRE